MSSQILQRKFSEINPPTLSNIMQTILKCYKNRNGKKSEFILNLFSFL